MLSIINTAFVNQASSPASPQTASFANVGSGTNRQAVCFLFSIVNNPTINSVTVGTAGLTLQLSSTHFGSSRRLQLWGGSVDTVSGAQTLTVNFTPIGGGFAFAAYGFIVSGSDAINGAVGSFGTTSPLSLAMTSPSGDLTMTGMTNNDTVIASTNQTIQKSQVVGGVLDVTQVDSGPATTNPTHTWTQGSAWSQVIIVGVNFRAVASGQAPRSMQQFRRRRQ